MQIVIFVSAEDSGRRRRQTSASLRAVTGSHRSISGSHASIRGVTGANLAVTGTSGLHTLPSGEPIRLAHLEIGHVPLLVRALRSAALADARRALIVGAELSAYKSLLTEHGNVDISVKWLEVPAGAKDTLGQLLESDLLEPNFWMVETNRVFGPGILKLLSPSSVAQLPNGEWLAAQVSPKLLRDGLRPPADVAPDPPADVAPDPPGEGLEDLASQLENLARNTGANPAVTGPSQPQVEANIGLRQLLAEAVERDELKEIGTFGHLAFSISVDREAEQAERDLIDALRKPLGRDGDGFVAFYLNRTLSIPITQMLLPTRITPNQISVFGLILGLLAAFMACLGSHYWLAIAGALLQFSSVLDGVDGEIARMKLLMSSSGEWLDTIIDDVINLSFFAALGYACFSRFEDPIFAYVTMGTMVAGVVSVVGLYGELQRRGLASHNNFVWGFEKSDSSLPGPIRSLLTTIGTLFKRDSYTLLLMLCLFFDNLRTAFWLMAVGIVIIFVAFCVQSILNKIAD
jgi:phosphatidylglycerophosphate synthase